MMRLSHIVRHPIKSIGYEELSHASLYKGRVMDFDRHWAVAHEAAKFQGQPEGWQAKMNFLRGVAGPELMAIRAQMSDSALTLCHPRAGQITLDLDTEAGRDRLIAWLRPLWPENRPAPSHVVRVPGQAMTDMRQPWLSILSLDSLRDLGVRMGADLSIHRWRGNLWVEGCPPMTEMGLIGRKIRIGEALLEVHEPITRCRATCVNPNTGSEDAETLIALETAWGHKDFGIYAQVIEDGKITIADKVEVL